ncbi:MAG TPA: DUF3197 domain-containing protein [Deinococcales bacterium]|nr:DUF3197 domain-containing protein [Deinococcales bacterium]
MDSPSAPTTLEPVGFQGQPGPTLDAVRAAAKALDLHQAEVIVVTDWQGQRPTARYAVLIHARGRSVLSEDAFGPRYGREGGQALRDLILGLQERGVLNFKERVLAPHEFTRIMDTAPAGLVQSLNAGGNPVDPKIYTDLA